MALIEGYNAREIICKNDDCRKLLGYEKGASGVLIFICPRCKQTSVFKISHGHGRELIDKIVKSVEERQITKGGEK